MHIDLARKHKKSNMENRNGFFNIHLCCHNICHRNIDSEELIFIWNTRRITIINDSKKKNLNNDYSEMKILHFTHVECTQKLKKTSKNSVFCAHFCLLTPSVGLCRTMKANESNTEPKKEILHSS